MDILREMSLRHMRLTREKALVSIDPMARVMYVVSGAAPVHIRCFSLDLLFEPVEFTINTKSVVRRCSSSNSNDNNYDSCYFAPKKAYLTESRNHLVLVGSTQVVAFNVRDFLIDVRMHPRPEYPLKPCAQLMADTAICDTFPCADNVLVLTEGALLRLCLNRSGNSAANTAEELARFRFTPTSRPLKVWAKTSSAYWVLFSDSSIKIFL